MSMVWIATRIVAAVSVELFGGAASAQVNDSMIVSTAWLASHIKDPSVVVVDAAMFSMGEDSSYFAGHIPGARLVKSSTFITTRHGLDSELPSVEQIRDRLEQLGISDSTRVVVYAPTAPTAARILFTLDYIGHKKYSFLDGGIKRWRAEGRPITREIPRYGRGHITVHPHPEIVASADWILAHTGRRGASLIDTRSDGEYLGTAARHGMPSEGHIAGAHQLQWEQLFKDGEVSFNDLPALQKLYADRVVPGDTVITYCWVGYRASMTYFVARYLGYPTKMYDGSYQDWQKRKLPVRAGATP